MKIMIAAAGLAAGLAVPALAQSVPAYSARAWCNQVAASVGSTSYMILKGCLDQEAEARAIVARRWSRIPAETKKWCDEVARSPGGGSYALLNGCLDQELEARGSIE